MTNRTAMIRARTEPVLKQKAEEILHKLGLSASDAINIFYNQIVLHKGIPFDISLEEEDTPENYIPVKNIHHFNELIGLGDGDL